MKNYQQDTQSAGSTQHPEAISIIKTLDNPYSDRDYIIALDISELTCLCPINHQPSFGNLSVEYIPDYHCLELKSFKQYVHSFRGTSYFQEALINHIRDQLSATLAPRYLRIIARFQAVDGIGMQITADYQKKGWLFEQPLLPQHPKLLDHEGPARKALGQAG